MEITVTEDATADDITVPESIFSTGGTHDGGTTGATGGSASHTEEETVYCSASATCIKPNTMVSCKNTVERMKTCTAFAGYCYEKGGQLYQSKGKVSCNGGISYRECPVYECTRDVMP